jgi:bifunctional UDP-N-acetylglucosamine pyrophosphorylase/glucosamine-1-phosphate N-acetyltransferase
LKIATVILAAGQGTRMKSDLVKVLHPIGGRAMVERSIEAAGRVDTNPPVVVVGHNADAVRAHLGERVRYALQSEQLGTGHAVMQAADLLRGQSDLVLVFYSDMPLLRGETLRALVQAQQAHDGPFSMLTMTAPDPRGFGRIVRTDGFVSAIVEEHEATAEQKLIRELNPGVYVFKAEWLWSHLPLIRPKKKGEYYVTDLVEIAVTEGGRVQGIPAEDNDEMIGVNTRVHLSEAEAALRRRINRGWMLEGVTIADPATTYIEESVVIGHDTVILPNTHLTGHTVIGSHCRIGPNSIVRDTRIADDCTVICSVLESATLESQVDIGPFGHLRPGAYLEAGVHMGNFGEVKNSRLGKGTRMGHFSYVGDSAVGADVNIGAGVVTANFDGVRKHKTTIGDHAFIGSDTMLIAPITIGENARTAAGAVVTHDVPDGALAVGVPARLRSSSDTGDKT